MSNDNRSADDVLVCLTWSLMSLMNMALVRWHTTWSNVSVHPTTSVAHARSALKVTTGPRKVHTSALVFPASVTTALTHVTRTQELASSVLLGCCVIY